MGNGYATVPARTCEMCGEQAICKDGEGGRLCRRCEVIGEALDATIRVSEDFMALVLVVANGVVPDIERLFEVGAGLVAEGLRYAAEHPDQAPYFGRPTTSEVSTTSRVSRTP